MDSINLNYFIHAANVLLLSAYSVRSILWLRVLAVASSLAAIPYFLLQPTPLWAAFWWSVLFTGINLFQAWRLLLERRPVRLTPEEEEVRLLVFRDLPPRKVVQILSLGFWNIVAPGERLIEQGKPVERLSLIVQGKVRLTARRQVLGDLDAGEFVGSALLLSGTPAQVEGVALEPTRLIQWEVATLERYLDANPETRNFFQRHLARDLAGKLQRIGEDFSSSPSLGSPSARAH